MGELPLLVITSSPMFSAKEVKSFLHNGKFVPFEGKNKDLGIVKYCSGGFVDQDERCCFLLDDLRNSRFENGHPPLVADRAVLVIFVTSDRKGGMREALDYVMGKRSIRTNFAAASVVKTEDWGKRRIAVMGRLIGRGEGKFYKS